MKGFLCFVSVFSFIAFCFVIHPLLGIAVLASTILYICF